MPTQAEYDKIHGELADKYASDPSIIRFIRCMVSEQLWTKKELEEFVLKTLLNKKAEKTLIRYNGYAVFLSRINEKQFQDIITYKIG